jgi:hypothetical protein
MATASEQDVLITANRARTEYGLTIYEVMRLGAAGEIRTVAEPGRTLKYVRGDVARVARERAQAKAELGGATA